MTDRFARTAREMAAAQDVQASHLAQIVADLVAPRGDELALDVGTGTGALAFALAPLVREVVGVDRVPELLVLARDRAVVSGTATFVEADATALPFPDNSFDLVGTLRMFHHVARPEAAIAELTRVTRPGGRVLVVDQLAPDDPAEAERVERFERARDATHARLLREDELLARLAAHGAELLRARREEEHDQVGAFLDLAGCQGDARERAISLAPHGPDEYHSVVGWYLLEMTAKRESVHVRPN